MDTTAPTEVRSQSFLRAVWNRIGPWDLSLLAMILLLAVKVNYGTSVIHDVGMGDEIRYLRYGFDLDLPTAQESPLYAAWYFLLSHFASDPVDLYYLNWSLLPVMLALGLYAFVRAAGGAGLLAFLSAAAVLLSHFYYTMPRPMHFATSLVLFGLAIALAFRSLPTKLAVATLTCGVAAFARPEFGVSFLILAAAFIAVAAWESYYQPGRISHLIILGIIAFAPVMQLHQVFGNPLGGGRSDVAFGQHYALNKKKAGLIDQSRSPWHNYRAIVKEDFGRGDVGITDAMRIAPGKFLWHVKRNVMNVIPQSRLSLRILASDLMTFALQGYVALLLLGALAAAAIRLWKRPFSERWFRQAVPLLVGGAVLAPIVGATLLIFPRPHYLLCLLILSLALATALVGSSRFATWRGNRATALAILLVPCIVLVAPNHNIGWRFNIITGAIHRNDAQVNKKLLRVVELFQGVPFKPNPRVMEWAYSYLAYTDHDAKFYSPMQIGPAGFAAFIEKEEIDAVVISSYDLMIDKCRNDPDYMKFRETPPPGWVIIGKPGVECQIAVRREALRDAPLEHVVAVPTNAARL